MAESLGSIAPFQRRSMLRKILSSLIAIGQCTRRTIDCGIASCHFDRTVFSSLLAAGVPVAEASKLHRTAHDQPFRHHRFRRKFLDVGRTQRLAIFPRAPPFTKRRIRTTRRKPHGYRSIRGVIDREKEQAALSNNHTLFPIRGPRGQIGS